MDPGLFKQWPIIISDAAAMGCHLLVSAVAQHLEKKAMMKRVKKKTGNGEDN